MAAGPNELSSAQAPVIAFLSDAASHVGADHVDRIETHGNIIFLAGAHAWKLKRAVRFPYMDFSTLALRHTACLEEMAVNARLAPALYIACVAITREADGRLAFDGNGEVVEWAVKMHRFEQSDLLSARADEGSLTPELALAVADAVYASHANAPVHCDGRGASRVGDVLRDLVTAMRDLLSLGVREVEAFADAAWMQHAKVAGLLDGRAAQGFVRRCHGDLHAANIVVLDGEPMLYDAIEFDPAIATVDTLYDLAFLLMDLERRGRRPAANVILNRMLWLGRDYLDIEGLAALPLFMALRAGIRAMVTAQRAAQEPAESARADEVKSREMLRAALGYLDTAPPALIAVAGLSGTGKSTLAALLAPWSGSAPGAVHLRTDLIRKALAGVAATERLAAETYTLEASKRVYDELARQARLALQAGRSVVADAVSAHAHEREMLHALAQDIGVPFRGLWLAAPAEVLVARVTARRNDASDATADVVRTQLGWNTADVGEGWVRIDAGGTPDATFANARAVLGDLIRFPDDTDPDR
jgi:aminoglycoside phosphotransferase family enzyme/predicted kinase